MPQWDLLLTDARAATLGSDSSDYGIIDEAALAVTGGHIAWIGPQSELPAASVGTTRSLGRRWITPALIDCHTHLVFGGDRGAEYEARLGGTSYQEIAASGGGILATVRATREASADALFDTGLARALALAAEGAATIEIKSGYGLDVANEIKMLEVARRIGEASGLTIRTTLLAAHAVPPEFEGRADAYIDLICDELLPEVAGRGLADAVDAYCESIAFRAPQIAKLFRCAQALGLPVKLHADQLSDGGGAELAAYFEAQSADHLEYSSPGGIRALAASGTAAVLLPGAYLTLNESRQPPVDDMRENGVPIALATDCNPGTSPVGSLREAMALASRVFRLTPLECLAGVTRNAAIALGLLADRGTLEVGKRADIAIWDINHPRDLCYWLGVRQLAELIVQGSVFGSSPSQPAA